jgi:hypothetical protein
MVGGPRKHVVQFSSGAGSAVAAKRVAERYGTDNLILLFADVNGEDYDNYRFLDEAHQWIGGELVILDNDGRTIWDAFREAKFLGNSRIDPCSRMLKREPIRRWMDENCNPHRTVSYLGFDWTEMDRHERALPHWAPFRMQSPLMWEPMLDKAEALAVLKFAGIRPPQLTRDGFPHANCGGGCIKAGIGQFAKLLEYRRSTFLEWEANEQAMREFLGKDVAILRDRRGGTSKPLTLTDLRIRLEGGDTLTDEERLDMGACNCMTPPEGTEDEVPVWFTAERQS